MSKLKNLVRNFLAPAPRKPVTKLVVETTPLPNYGRTVSGPVDGVTFKIGSNTIHNGGGGDFNVSSTVGSGRRVNIIQVGRHAKIMVDGRNEIVFQDGLFSGLSSERVLTYMGLTIVIDPTKKLVTIN